MLDPHVLDKTQLVHQGRQRYYSTCQMTSEINSYQHPDKHKRRDFLNIPNSILNSDIIVSKSRIEQSKNNTKTRNLHNSSEHKIRTALKIERTPLQKNRINGHEGRDFSL